MFRNIYVPAQLLLSIGTFVVFYSSFELAAAIVTFTRGFYCLSKSGITICNHNKLFLPSSNVVKKKQEVASNLKPHL